MGGGFIDTTQKQQKVLYVRAWRSCFDTTLKSTIPEIQRVGCVPELPPPSPTPPPPPPRPSPPTSKGKTTLICRIRSSRPCFQAFSSLRTVRTSGWLPGSARGLEKKRKYNPNFSYKFSSLLKSLKLLSEFFPPVSLAVALFCPPFQRSTGRVCRLQAPAALAACDWPDGTNPTEQCLLCFLRALVIKQHIGFPSQAAQLWRNVHGHTRTHIRKHACI